VGCIEGGEVELCALDFNMYGVRYVISVIPFQVVNQR
jgi:hypothetical protein